MKKFAFIFALFVFLKPVLPFVEYLALYDYIKNELCENRQAPELKCNGKCHLSKELAKASEQESSSDKKAHSSETQVLFFHFSEAYTLQKIPVLNLKQADEVAVNFYENQFTLSLLKPPAVLG